MQKYRSHRKHLLAREAEAASWSQRRQIYGGATAGSTNKRDMGPWMAPTMGFPPVTPMHPFRPLHVWGHPSVDQSAMHWPKHMVPPPPPPQPHQPPLPMWPPVPPPPLVDLSYWHTQHRVSILSLPLHVLMFLPENCFKHYIISYTKWLLAMTLKPNVPMPIC